MATTTKRPVRRTPVRRAVKRTPRPAPVQIPIDSAAAEQIVMALVAETVDDIRSRSNGGVVLRQEAQGIWDLLSAEHPEALLAWLLEHGVGLLRQLLAVRLANDRARARRSAFSETGEVAAHPFAERVAVNGDRWVQRGDMRRPDWIYLIEQRSTLAEASLFEVALARLVVKKLPNDDVRTRDVLSESELERMEKAAQRRAEASVRKFTDAR